MKNTQQNKHISLKQAPLLSKFISKIIAFDNKAYSSKPFPISCDWENELFITGMCQCKQSDCATVYLRRKKAWPKNNQGAYLINTTKGIIIFQSKGILK